MQFEEDFWFGMNNTVSIGRQSLSCSSAYEPLTPARRRPTQNAISLDTEGTYTSFGAHHHELTSASSHMSRYMFGGSVKADTEHMPFNEGIPTATRKKIDGMATPEYDQMLEMSMASRNSIGSITASESFPTYAISPTTMVPTSFTMTPTHSLSSSEMAECSSSWSYFKESPISLSVQNSLDSFELDGLDLDRHSHSPLEAYHLLAPTSPVHRKMMVHEIQRKTTKLRQGPLRASRKAAGCKSDGVVDAVRRTMCKCDYPGCYKAFRRSEHLKRHKQSFHGDGPNRFLCAFCGKDQFNRQDNLNNHRKLHARPNGRNRGVEFIPAAVPIIEQEERNRKKRAPPKSESDNKRGDY